MKNILFIVLGSALFAAGWWIGGSQQFKSYKYETVQSTLIDTLITDWTDGNVRDPDVLTAALIVSNPLPDARRGYFPDTVRSLAKFIEKQYKVPVAITLAQFALESRFGLSALNDHNYFGHTFAAVKRYMTDPAALAAYDRNYENGKWIRVRVRFARYNSVADCFMTHGKYLSGSSIYKKAFKAKTVEGFARELGKRYAVDPDYAIKLITIIRRYHLG